MKLSKRYPSLTEAHVDLSTQPFLNIESLSKIKHWKHLNPTSIVPEQGTVGSPAPIQARQVSGWKYVDHHFTARKLRANHD